MTTTVVRIQPLHPSTTVGHDVWRVLARELSATGHDVSDGGLLVAFDAGIDAAAEIRDVLSRHGWDGRFLVRDFSSSSA